MKPYLTIHFGGGRSVVTWGQATTDEEFEQMYQLRYKVYRRKGLMKELDGNRDHDYLDRKGCHHFIAMYEGRVIGSARMIYAHPLPTEQTYFDIDLPPAITEIPANARFEIGRLTSDLGDLPLHIPRHLVLLGNLYAMLRFALDEGFAMSLGTVKHYVRQKFEYIGLPITYLKYKEIKYDPRASNDPLETFFDLQTTGKVHPLYISLRDYADYIETLLNNPLCFGRMSADTYKMKSVRLFNAALAMRGLRHKMKAVFRPA